MVTSLARAADLAVKTPLLYPDTPVTAARKLMVQARARILPVVRDEKSTRLEAVLPRRSLLLVSSTKSTALVKDVAEQPKIVLDTETELAKAAETMLAAREPYAPVVGEANKLIGILGYEQIIEEILAKKPVVLSRPVQDYMDEIKAYVSPDEPVYRVWQLMLSTGLQRVPVVSGGRLVGVIAEHDLLAHGYTRPVLESSSARRGPKVREAMSTPAVYVEPDTLLAEAARLIVERGIGSVYVARAGEPLGVVDRSTVVAAWLGRRA